MFPLHHLFLRFFLKKGLGFAPLLVLNFAPSKDLTIFYDFACQLWRYCLLRKPRLVLDNSITFKVDRFHLSNHRCGPSIEADLCKTYSHINTSIVESRNSLLAFLKTITGSSGFATTVVTLTAIFVLYNRLFNRTLIKKRNKNLK